MTTTYGYIDLIDQRDIAELREHRILADNVYNILKAIGSLFGARTKNEMKGYATTGWRYVSILLNAKLK